MPSQPDHWRMIDAGWFGEGDLFEAGELDNVSLAWFGNYEPFKEAYNLLSDVYAGKLREKADELGLIFQDDEPFSYPRAGAYLLHEDLLPELQADLATRTQWTEFGCDLNFENKINLFDFMEKYPQCFGRI